MTDFEVTVRGVAELKAALEGIKGKVDPVTGKTLAAAAEPVKKDARRRAEGYSPRTVSGIRIRRKGLTIRVEQGMKKTTGYHTSYGSFQQRNFFDPALDDNQDEVVALLLDAIDALAEEV